MKGKEMVWIVTSQDNNNGKGGWDYHTPEHITFIEADSILETMEGNSMVDAEIFSTKKKATNYYNKMTNYES